MKSKTSFFNGTVFRKNLTRFAPAWGLYILALMLGLILMFFDTGGMEFWYAHRLGESIYLMPVVNIAYALLVAQLLFGDLYNTRMCNALHAMPLKREGWFWTNVISGMAFSAIPTFVMTAVSIPLLMLSCVINGWQIALWFFLGANLQYLCFFGIAVFCVFCAGNRLAMAVLYAIVNFAAVMAYFIIDTIFIPMFYGLVTSSHVLLPLCPLVTMMQGNYIDLDSYQELIGEYGDVEGWELVANFHVMDGWDALLIFAALGAVLILAALQMYKKRKLECAGDFMAVRFLEPVFLVAYSLMVGACLTFLANWLLSYHDTYVVFMPVGIVVGWFTGKMLLERSVKVFRGRSWLGLGTLAAVIALVFTGAYFDIFGIAGWVPEADQVKSVNVGMGIHSQYAHLTEQEDIEAIIQLQKDALEDRLDYTIGEPVTGGEVNFTYGENHQEAVAETAHVYTDYRYTVHFYLSYEMKDGRTFQRYYYVWADEPEGQVLEKYLSRWEAVANSAGMKRAELDTENVNVIYLEGSYLIPEEYYTQAEMEALRDAILADCEAGSMAQHSYFHHGYFLRMEDQERIPGLNLRIYTQYDYTGLEIYPESEHTLKWLSDRGFLQEIGYTAVTFE